ncbi:uncharacterized protein BX663DRAFT_495163 [Cokeromyces recurvatus]|uniref:uncharacterized protein n=1 Tax=Cokeromyces recurvatus TaxID=90255 RepID=UPI002220F10E|nr:uncharacterized protein BX663DRAFT_495163 [Cokeromyces recurvatus]KAI7907200.1 hypothetical protein BX663DRAFT_495163 [Cokeromyces recurvatus]
MSSIKQNWTLEFKKLWLSKLTESINCIAVGKPFLEELSEENDILIGTTAGRVLILNQTKPVEGLLETKGGSVQSIQLHDLTGFGALDLAVADCDGVVTLFSRQQILSKHELGSAITYITIHNDLAGGYEIIAGDINGTITAFQQHDTLWKLNIAEESAKLATLGMKGRRSPSIRCMLSTKLKDKFGMEMSCLLVCDGWPLVHFIQSGERIQTLRTPSVIQSMCSGYFIKSNDSSKFFQHSKKKAGSYKLDSQQVLLAGQDGFVYIMIDFEIFPWFNVGFCLNRVIQFRPSSLPKDETDIVLCTGYSNEVLIYQNGKKITQIRTSDWPHAITLGDVNADGQDELVLGLLDQTIEVYEWKIDGI